jgi:N-methylhydantoinase A/oxoprolinase/acetone carboxylase beta subunit
VRRRIGIDVGGTNTDAVLLEDDVVAAAVKTPP